MRVTRIDVRGAAPNRRAELTRDGGNVIASVWVEGEVHSHVVGASRRDDLYEMARRVQHALDGHIGTNGDVEDYWQAIQRLAD
ncbi:MAG: hypothetical protein R6X33_12985 [Candidatus Brocadiia bacterium]